MRFSQPYYLVLLIPAIVGLVYSFRHVHGMARARKRFAFSVRFLLAGLIIFALAGPEAYRPNHGLGVVFLLDRSDSVDDASKKQAEVFVDKALRSLGPNDVGGVIAFGKDAVVDAAPGVARPLSRVLSQVDGTASDIAGAVRLAAASLPEDKAKRIVLLTDGNETQGDAYEAAEVAATDHIQLDFVPLGQVAKTAEASVNDVEAPSDARADSPFDLKVNVDSNVDQKALLTVDRDGLMIKKMPVNLGVGHNTIVVSERLKDVGFHRYRATIQPQSDRDDRNNVGMAFVSLRGRPKMLVLQENTKDTELVDALKKTGLDVVLSGPGQAPVRPEDYQQYDAVVFNDFNANSITDGQMKVVQSAVRDSGVGFAMVGGENSFLPGGYYGSPIAEALPVDLNIRQRKNFPTTSILIVVDASGSMGMPENGVPKIRLAAQAAEKTVEMMQQQDRVGVAGSTDGIEFVAPMQQLTDKPAVEAGCRKLEVGGGGIYIKPSMDFGNKVLSDETTQVRHYILMADGDDSDMQEGAIAEALAMRANKITTTVVAIGTGKDVNFLRELAAAGGGRYYLAATASQLPQIVTQDASIISRSAIEEGAFYPKMTAGEPVLKGIDSTPMLLAYCLSEARPLAQVGMKTGKDDPLLATWQYGLGTSMAFTSDAQARWAKDWVGWPGFGAFWSQAAHEITRRATKGTYQIQVKQQGGKGAVEITASDALGYPMKAMASQVRVAMPNGDSKTVEVTQTAPGKFTGSFEATAIGSYIVTVAEPDPDGGTRVRSSGFSISYPAEYQSFKPNRPLLERMSSVTKGQALSKPLDALRPIKDPGASITELWALFVLIAGVLLPFDVGVRRIALPVGEIIAKLLSKLKLYRRSKQEAAVGQVDRLKVAKQRAQTEYLPSGAPVETSYLVPDAPKTRETDRPAAGVGTGGVATAKQLLAAKKQRKGEE
jgi:Ca-activated chloride channel family protein